MSRHSLMVAFAWLSCLLAGTLSSAAAASAPDIDAELTRLNDAVAQQPQRAAPLIARARYFYGKAYVDHELNSALLVLEWPLFADKQVQKLTPALADLDRAIELEPKLTASWLERGRMRLAYVILLSSASTAGFDFADVEKDFNRALELDPNNAEAWFELARTQLAMWTRQIRTVFYGIGKPEGPQVAQRALALRNASAALSRAIYLRPEASGEAHFLRALIQRDSPATLDLHEQQIDCTAAIDQALRPTDVEWGELRHSIVDRGVTAAALADTYLTRGRILRSQGKLAAALADFDAALTQYDVALADYDILRKVKDYHLNARFERGRLRVQRGDYDGALADFEPVIQEKRTPAEVWLWRALAHDAKGEIDAARADLENAFARDANLRARMAGTRYDAQAPNPQRGIAPKPVTIDVRVVPPGTALEHKDAGNQLRGKGDMDGALREYNTALLIDPDFADALNNRAGIYTDRGFVDLALVDYNRAIEIDPKHRAAYLNRGLLWRELNETARERADLDLAVEYATADPLRAGALAARSWTRRVANDAAGALEDAQKVTELTPDNAGAWLAIGHLQVNAAAYGKAEVAYRRAAELKPNDWEAHAYLALVLALRDDPSASAELHAALQWSKADEFNLIRALLERAAHNHPESAGVKALQTQLQSEYAERTKLAV